MGERRNSLLRPQQRHVRLNYSAKKKRIRLAEFAKKDRASLHMLLRIWAYR